MVFASRVHRELSKNQRARPRVPDAGRDLHPDLVLTHADNVSRD